MTNKMTYQNMAAERRKHHRYKTNQDAFVSFNPRSFQLGRIINIGKGGLAFIHVDIRQPVATLSKMALFLPNDGFRLSEIPYKIVSEFELKNKSSNNDLILLQCCIAFGHLTQFQNVSLDYYLENYTTGQF
jgi:hypothetical protein